MRKRSLLLIATAALAGCGGHHRQAPPSHAAFVSALNDVCAKAETRSGRVARLRALRAPAADRDLFAHWLAAERDALDLVQHPPKEHITPAVALAIDQGKIAGYARRIGAEECAESATGTLPP